MLTAYLEFILNSLLVVRNLLIVALCVFTALPAYAVKVTTIATGRGHHSMSLDNQGKPWIWGKNHFGQLGNGKRDSDKHYPVPASVPGLPDLKVLEIAPARYYTLVLLEDGTVWAWGRNNREIKTYQLGTGSDSVFIAKPVQVQDLTNVKHVIAGTHHSFAITQDGNLWAWGLNECGQLGLGTSDTKDKGASPPTPRQVKNLHDVISAAPSRDHSLAVTADGTVWAWGLNESGQLGYETTTRCEQPSRPAADGNGYPCSTEPQPVPGVPAAVAVSVGGDHSLALTRDGTVWAWGFGKSGELGNGKNVSSMTPVQVNDLTDVIAIDAGTNHSLALKRDGTVWAWGSNKIIDFGEVDSGYITAKLGAGLDKNGSNVPIQVKNVANIVAISAGWGHSFALAQDGTVWAWGANESGQIGNGIDGFENAVKEPTPIPLPCAECETGKPCLCFGFAKDSYAVGDQLLATLNIHVDRVNDPPKTKQADLYVVLEVPSDNGSPLYLYLTADQGIVSEPLPYKKGVKLQSERIVLVDSLVTPCTGNTYTVYAGFIPANKSIAIDNLISNLALSQIALAQQCP